MLNFSVIEVEKRKHTQRQMTKKTILANYNETQTIKMDANSPLRRPEAICHQALHNIVLHPSEVYVILSHLSCFTG